MSHQIKASTGGYPATFTVSDKDWKLIKTLAEKKSGSVDLSNGKASRDGNTVSISQPSPGGHRTYEVSASSIF
jgi:hypothetical protein